MAAEMKVGEALVFLGSTVHGGGANVTLQPRPMHGFFYCRSWLRPEVCTLASRCAVQLMGAVQENVHLWFSRAEVMKWSLAAQKQAGYRLDNPFLGHCNETHPIELFRANEEVMET